MHVFDTPHAMRAATSDGWDGHSTVPAQEPTGTA